MKQTIYMDYNATSPIRPSVIEKVADAMKVVGNPSSVHYAGRAARGMVEEARAKIAALTAGRPRDVVFCSGGTEAANAVLSGCGAKSIIVSSVEHDCVLAAANRAAEDGLEVRTLPVGRDGIVLLDDLADMIAELPAPTLVSVMLVNNEVGTIQPVSEVATTAKSVGALVHCDAVQAAGKISLDIQALGVDYMTLSAHKLGGPQGIGAIVLAPTAPLKPLIVGGGQELGRRSGTENVASIAGFGEAAFEAMGGIADSERLRSLRDHMERSIKEYGNEAVVIGEQGERVGSTSCIAIPGIKGETQVMHFDLAGVCVSSGSACSSGKVRVSHVLEAMGYEPEIASSSIRISLGYGTTEKDVDAFLGAWRKLYDRVTRR